LGGREDCYVSRVRASYHKEGRAYVAKNGYKLDDFRPFVYKTENFGETWTSLAGNLPNEPVNVIYEDQKNPNLLFVGNDTGIFVSINGGKDWVKMNNNIPNVPVHDVLVHPRENDLILGSYGRGLFVTNIAPLQEMNEVVLAKDVYLFGIKPKVQRVIWAFGANDFLFGDRHILTPNEPNGIVIRYYLKEQRNDKANITITDPYGKEVARLEGKTSAGINTVIWDMRPLREGKGRAARRWWMRGVLEQWVQPGEYVVILEIGDKKLTQKVRITKTQGWSIGPFPQIIRYRP
jgi:hypothetical protein